MYIVYLSLKERDTPLHDAVRAGRNEVCLLLLQNGADVNYKNKVSTYTQGS